MTWTLAQAKDQLSEVVRRAAHSGPQIISVRGRDAAVVLTKEDYERLRAPDRPRSLKDALTRMKFDGVDLGRDQAPARDIEL